MQLKLKQFKKLFFLILLSFCNTNCGTSLSTWFREPDLKGFGDQYVGRDINAPKESTANDLNELATGHYPSAFTKQFNSSNDIYNFIKNRTVAEVNPQLLVLLAQSLFNSPHLNDALKHIEDISEHKYNDCFSKTYITSLIAEVRKRDTKINVAKNTIKSGSQPFSKIHEPGTNTIDLDKYNIPFNISLTDLKDIFGLNINQIDPFTCGAHAIYLAYMMAYCAKNGSVISYEDAAITWANWLLIYFCYNNPLKTGKKVLQDLIDDIKDALDSGAPPPIQEGFPELLYFETIKKQFGEILSNPDMMDCTTDQSENALHENKAIMGQPPKLLSDTIEKLFKNGGLSGVISSVEYKKQNRAQFIDSVNNSYNGSTSKNEIFIVTYIGEDPAKAHTVAIVGGEQNNPSEDASKVTTHFTFDASCGITTPDKMFNEAAMPSAKKNGQGIIAQVREQVKDMTASDTTGGTLKSFLDDILPKMGLDYLGHPTEDMIEYVVLKI